VTQDPSIVSVEATPVVVTGDREFRISEGRTRTHVSVILRLLTDIDGLEGNAEIVSAPPGKPEEILEEILAAARNHVAPALVGRRAADRTAACAAVERGLKGRIWTKAAVNVALHDLQAKSLGVPVTDLLGGRLNDTIPVIGPVIGIKTPDEMAKQAADEVAEGFSAIKIKIGETPDMDIQRVAAVREAIGGGIMLRVDANDHYQPADAIHLIRALERHELEHVEQPVLRGDLLGMAEVRRNVGVPIMTDDTVATPQDAMNVIRLGAADRAKVKVTKHGFDGARLIINMFELAGLKCVLGHVFEMGLAAVAEAHLAAASRNLAVHHEIGSLRPMGVTADVITDNLQPEPGFVRIPDGPGLGVRLDWNMIGSWGGETG
jgi:muconate cycloisomerase